MYLTGKNKRRKQRDSTGHDREKENAAAAASAANLDVREDEVRDPAAMVSVGGDGRHITRRNDFGIGAAKLRCYE